MKKVLALTVAVLLPLDSFASPIVVDANGSFVGFYSWVSPPLEGNTPIYRSENAVSSTGYRFSFSRRLGVIMKIDGRNDGAVVEFATSNCTGQAHIMVDYGVPGYVTTVLFSQPTPAYYVAQDALASRVTLRSALSEFGGCNPFLPTEKDAYPALINDSDVTGVNTSWPAPLRVTVSAVFRDGFEVPGSS